jgi:hypothetical protein
MARDIIVKVQERKDVTDDVAFSDSNVSFGFLLTFTKKSCPECHGTGLMTRLIRPESRAPNRTGKERPWRKAEMAPGRKDRRKKTICDCARRRARRHLEAVGWDAFEDEGELWLSKKYGRWARIALVFIKLRGMARKLWKRAFRSKKS